MAGRSRPKGRQSTTHSGTTDPAGAVVPEPRIRRRAGAEPEPDGSTDGFTDEGTAPEAPPPAEVVHLIPAEHLDTVDTTGMSMPVGVGSSASAVRLPGDTVLTRPDESDIPSDAELDVRDAAKGTRRKRTGPKPPAAAQRDPNAPAESAPPPTDPTPAGPPPTDPTDPS